MVKSKKFRIRYSGVCHKTIHQAISNFIKKFDLAPHILLVNAETGHQLDIAMSTEVIASGETDSLQEIGMLCLDLTDLVMCIDENLRNKEFLLVYDDEAIFGPNLEDFFGVNPQIAMREAI